MRTRERGSKPQLTLADVRRLRSAATSFGGEAAARKSTTLAECARRALERERVLVEYHDALLFLIAHPDTDALARAAERELRRVAAAARVLAGLTRLRSGIAWSEVDAAFSFDLARWLVRRFPGHAELTAFGDEGRALSEVLSLALPVIDAEMLAGPADPLALLDEARGCGVSRLEFLVRHLERLPATRSVQGQLFDSLAPFLTVAPRGSHLSRTFARGPVTCRFLHRVPLDKSTANARTIIGEPLPSPRQLTAGARIRLVDLARSTLAMLARETDPLTWTSRDGVALYELDRGVSVALYPMDPARRFALDSHTGYLLLKNGVPAGYGGGWPFLRSCRTGVNIFPALRGGESNLLFAQVLRVYQQHFQVARFVVEPYQFGAGNREGLASGAFWFYYRLGFRPVDRDTRMLAREAFARIEATPGYRSPIATMRALTGSDLALDCARTAAADRVEPAEIALAVSRWIGRVHRGDRHAAQGDALRRVTAALACGGYARWPAAERDAFRSLALVVGLIPDLASWPREEREACVALMRAKGATDDAPYFRQLAAHPRLPAALLAISRRA